jgi:Lrp/AsnC family transcriptional regulator for asnA, asnC and gidA
MSTPKYEIDDLDLGLLRHLQEDARKPFLEIARELDVSGGTIHQRYDKLKENEVILGHKTTIDPRALGFGILAFVGVHVNRTQDIPELLNEVRSLKNVVEAHYTTGDYALFLKVYAKDMEDYYFFLMKRLQKIKGIRSTESFMCMATPIQRELEVK